MKEKIASGHKGKNVIVFGGSGFLGSYVCDALSDAGYRVRIYDLIRSSYLRPDQEMIQGDILDAPKVEKSVKGCHIVYNFAGISDLDDSRTRPLDTVRLNVIGNLHIMDAAVSAKVERYVYASSIYVYSEKGGFYRCSKQSSEIYIEEYQRHFGLNFSVLRFGTLYGPRADRRNSVYRYLSQAVSEGVVSCFGTGDEVRDYIHVRDAARLSVEALSEMHKNKHIIISGYQPIKFKEMISIMAEILNKPIKIRFKKCEDLTHYKLTPYSFNPKIGEKLLSHTYTDVGQGLLECLQDIHKAEKH